MSMMKNQDDLTIYKVVVNHEEQYSIWPSDRKNPLGWNDAGKTGPKEECLEYIKDVWTDMRPLSLRKHMEEMEKRRPELEHEEALRREKECKEPKDPRDDLVQFLSHGNHPVEAGLTPDKTVEELKACIDRGYVYIKFTDTRGGTELGFHLDDSLSDLRRANFENGSGTACLAGQLTLNYVKVKCIADINLETLQGHGHLEPVEAQNSA